MSSFLIIAYVLLVYKAEKARIDTFKTVLEEIGTTALFKSPKLGLWRLASFLLILYDINRTVELAHSQQQDRGSGMPGRNEQLPMHVHMHVHICNYLLHITSRSLVACTSFYTPCFWRQLGK